MFEKIAVFLINYDINIIFSFLLLYFIKEYVKIKKNQKLKELKHGRSNHI